MREGCVRKGNQGCVCARGKSRMYVFDEKRVSKGGGGGNVFVG